MPFRWSSNVGYSWSLGQMVAAGLTVGEPYRAWADRVTSVERTGHGACAPVDTRTAWVVRRMFPLLALAGLLVVGMATTTWGAQLIGQHGWSLPHDLWRTLVAADRVRRGDLGGLYTPPTALVTFPGAALILVPVVALINATGGNLVFQSAQNPEPSAWLLAGPYEIALSAVALLAADALAERMGAARRTRALLAAAGGVALWNVSVQFGHPEDAVAIAFLLYGVLALSADRRARAAWLIGAGVAVQPLILLGLLVVLAVLPVRSLPGFLGRAAVPGLLVLGVAAAANWSATVRAVTGQPNWPASRSNHLTPWTALAPEVGGGAVSAGPGRMLAVLFALAVALVAGRRWRIEHRPAIWDGLMLSELLWWVAVALAMRCVFESVMVSFYLWPILAVALTAAAVNWARLLATSAAACAITMVEQASWPGPWLWWGLMTAGLAVTLALSRPSEIAGNDRTLSIFSSRRRPR